MHNGGFDASKRAPINAITYASFMSIYYTTPASAVEPSLPTSNPPSGHGFDLALWHRKVAAQVILPTEVRAGRQSARLDTVAVFKPSVHAGMRCLWAAVRHNQTIKWAPAGEPS